jgi:hypothetical protein
LIFKHVVYIFNYFAKAVQQGKILKDLTVEVATQNPLSLRYIEVVNKLCGIDQKIPQMVEERVTTMPKGKGKELIKWVDYPEEEGDVIFDENELVDVYLDIDEYKQEYEGQEEGELIDDMDEDLLDEIQHPGEAKGDVAN